MTTTINTLSLADAATRVTFYLFDVDREDLSDGILDVLDPSLPPSLGPRDDEEYTGFITRIDSIDLGVAVDYVVEALVLKGSGLAACLLDVLASRGGR